MDQAVASTEQPPRLRRVLGLGDLIFYGIVAVTPSAPATVFGVASRMSRGHAIVTMLLAMVAMVSTAVSYGRMAALYPSAGSAYTYVGRGLNPHLGFLAGWAMLLDYIASPLFCVIYGTLAVERLTPGAPFAVWALVLAGGITWLNVRGIRSTARANQVLLSMMGVVLLAYVVCAIRYVVHGSGPAGLLSLKPFYDPASFDVRAIAGATSFAALTYLGFDSVTTLAEDVHNPRRNVLLAAVSVCLFTGVFGGLLVYLGQLVWPDYSTFTNIETAFMDVTRRAGGPLLFQAMAVLLLLANIGAGLTTQVGAARLLFGMGRDGVLPRRFFAHLDARRNTPVRNIVLIGILAYGGSFVMSYELVAEILNFGAFLGFMGVNAAALRQSFSRQAAAQHRNWFLDGAMPVLGFVFCLGIWLCLQPPAKIAGGIWFVLGTAILAWQTKGFRLRPAMLEIGDRE